MAHRGTARDFEAAAAAATASIDFDTAASRWEDAADVWLAEGESAEAARCLIEQAQALRKRLNYPACQRAATRSLALLDGFERPLLEADARRALAIALRHLGHDDDALAELAEASRIYEDAGRLDGVAFCVNNASHILRDQGKYHRAITELEGIVARVEHLDAEWKSMLLTTLGLARRRVGDSDGALAAHTEALVIARRWGRRSRIGAALSNLAATRRMRGDLEGAELLYAEVIEIASPVPGLRPLLMNTFNNLSTLERQMGRYPEALEHATLALNYHRRRRPQRRTSAHISLGHTYAAMGEYDLALHHFRNAWRYYRSRGHHMAAARVRFVIGRVIRDQHPDDPRVLRRVLRYWVPVYVELDAARFQFPRPAERRRWQQATSRYRVPIFEIAEQLGDTQLIADMVESAIHSGAYGTQGAAELQDQDDVLSEMPRGDEDGEGDAGTGDVDETPAITLGGAVAALAGSTLPLLPTPPLTAPYGRLRLGRYRAAASIPQSLSTW